MNKQLNATTVNARGQVKVLNESLDKNEKQKFLSYITADDFEELDEKFFHLKEIENLLGSSDFHQRMYAMDIVINTVKIQPVDFVLERFFDEERSSILKRIKMMIKTSSRTDAIVKIIQVYNEISSKVAGPC